MEEPIQGSSSTVHQQPQNDLQEETTFNANLTETPAVNVVRKLLFRRLLVGVKDGRFFVGSFHCLDKQDPNVGVEAGADVERKSEGEDEPNAGALATPKGDVVVAPNASADGAPKMDEVVDVAPKGLDEDEPKGKLKEEEDVKPKVAGLEPNIPVEVVVENGVDVV
ncbi:hypothetical protein EJ110_NYTH21255 [Nymphaea thermarum]|nr:hypothetical protein EJ110_NYTH21255 [Nymphaea thermarum]